MILSQEEHDELKKIFPKVKSRCPVCYIDSVIERKMKNKKLFDIPKEVWEMIAEEKLKENKKKLNSKKQ